MYKDKKSRNGRLPSSKQTRCAVGSRYSCSLEHKLCYILTMAQSMKKEIRKTFGFGKEKFNDKVRLDTKMPGVPIILSKSVYIYLQSSKKMSSSFICFYKCLSKLLKV